MNAHTTPMTSIVDRLAAVKAEIAVLETMETELKELLVASGEKVIMGTMHRASISYCDGREKIDWQSVAMKFNPSRQLITAHTSKGDPFYVVRMGAHKGSK